MLTRSGFKRPQRERQRTVHQPIPEHQRPQVSYTGTTKPAPKTEPLRNPAIMEMANKRPCLMLVPGVCNGDPETTVAAHSNWSEHGKAGRRKADDIYTAWACACCHSWLDQGNTAPAEEKRPHGLPPTAAKLTTGTPSQMTNQSPHVSAKPPFGPPTF